MRCRGLNKSTSKSHQNIQPLLRTKIFKHHKKYENLILLTLFKTSTFTTHQNIQPVDI